MKKNTKKIFTLSILTLFLFFITTATVSAQETPAILGKVQKFIAGWGAGELDLTVAKWLLFVLIFLLIFGIADKIPGLPGKEKWWLRTGVAVIISFLATVYITPDEVYGILISYNALGFVLAGFLPILLLGLFTWSLANHDPEQKASVTAFNKFIAGAMWVAFGIVSVWKALNADSWVWFAVYGVLAIFTIIFAVNTGRAFDWIGGNIRQEKLRKFAEAKQTVAAADSATVQQVEETTGEKEE